MEACQATNCGRSVAALHLLAHREVFLPTSTPNQGSEKASQGLTASCLEHCRDQDPENPHHLVRCACSMGQHFFLRVHMFVPLSASIIRLVAV